MNITANNNGFILPPGTRLALLDESGNVLNPDAGKEAFFAAVDAYIKISQAMVGDKLTPANPQLKKAN